MGFIAMRFIPPPHTCNSALLRVRTNKHTFVAACKSGLPHADKVSGADVATAPTPARRL